MAFLESVIVRDTWGFWPTLAAGTRGDLAHAADHLARCEGPLVVALGDDLVMRDGAPEIVTAVAAVSTASVLSSFREVELLVSVRANSLLSAVMSRASQQIRISTIQDVGEMDRRVSPAADLIFVGAGARPSAHARLEAGAALSRFTATRHHSVGIVTGPHGVGIGRLPAEFVTEAAEVEAAVPVATDHLVVAASPLWGAWALCTAVALLEESALGVVESILSLEYVARLTSEVGSQLRQGEWVADSEGSELSHELDRSVLAAITHVLDPSVN